MVRYKRIERTKKDGTLWYSYTKDHLMVNTRRVPAEIVEKLMNPEYADSIDYDDQPTKPRCLACDAPRCRQKYLNGNTYYLCEWHYQHMRLGQLAQVVREQEESNDVAKKVKTVKKVSGRTRRRRKTALSQVIE